MRTPELFSTFLKIGATGFGGQMPLIALIQEQVVERKGWLRPAEFSLGLTIGETLPGPIVVDLVAYIGYRLRGWRGAVVSTAGFILPAFLLMLVLSILYSRFGELPELSPAFKGVGAAVIALVISASYRMAGKTIKDWRGLLILGAAMGGRYFFQLDVVLILLGAGLLGLLLYRPTATANGRPPDPSPAGAR